MHANGDRVLDPARICTLPPEDFRDRLAWIERVILPHVVASERGENARFLELEDVPGLDGKLERWIEAERRCCHGVEIEAGPSPTPGRVRLAIRGIDPDAPVFHEVIARPQGEVPPVWASRLARSLGLGAAAALLLCCALPLGASAVFGGSLAFLTALDAPIPIGLSAGVGAAIAWRWLGRQASRTSRAQTGCATDPP